MDIAEAYKEGYVDGGIEAMKRFPGNKGKWVQVDDEEPIAYDCSICGAMVGKKFNYCPNCGADMKGDNE